MLHFDDDDITHQRDVDNGYDDFRHWGRPQFNLGGRAAGATASQRTEPTFLV